MTRWGDWEPEPPEIAVRDWGCGVRMVQTSIDCSRLWDAVALFASAAFLDHYGCPTNLTADEERPFGYLADE